MKDPRETIRQYILTQFLPGESPSNLQDDTPLRSSGILDSLSTLKLVDYIEREFAFQVEAHEVNEENFGTLDSVVTFVRARAPAK